MIEEPVCTVEKCIDDSGNNILLGKGSYGKVYRGFYKLKDKIIHCAIKEMEIKCIISGFGNLNEIENLVRMSKSPFFPKIYTVFLDKYKPLDLTGDFERKEYLSLVTDLAEMNCSSFFKTGNYSFYEAKLMFSQILLGLDHMHRRGISHRDLKPSNILLYRTERRKIHLKISDLGLATTLSHKGERDSNVHTIWYRAPEIMHDVLNYKTTADIWCAGVIFYEIIVGPHMFSPVGDNPSMSKYLEFCINNVADDFTVSLQNMYRANSNENPCIFKSRDVRAFKRSVQSYTGKFRSSNRFKTKPSLEEMEECSTFVMSCITFDYKNRPSASELLKNSFLDCHREYITEKHEEQYSENVFDVINFTIPEHINNKKVEFFQAALRKINFMPMRQFFYAVDLINRFFTIYPNHDDDKINDIFSAILYKIHKMFTYIHCPKEPYKFFFNKFPSGSITEEQFQKLDFYIFNFEKVFLQKEPETGNLIFIPLIRRCLYDMQVKYKSNIQSNEKHCLTMEQLKILLIKFCEIREWNENRSYRYMYRLLYNRHIDPTFEIDQ